ncbi:MAG: dihydropteroate synthase [Bacteroidales bacterium]|nr:dihydropteroate synthase [Bacteroidales bacterium]
MAKIMAIVNLTPDSFWAASRVPAGEAQGRVRALLEAGADIIDLGAVSTRPGAQDVSLEEEWRRLEPVVRAWDPAVPLSVDTTRAEIVRRVYDCTGPLIVNDISAGEDDPQMLGTVGRLGLCYIAMHKRGGPRTMDARCDYPAGILPALTEYFREFSLRAADAGIGDWVLDPGLGFAKTPEQNWEVLEGLDALRAFDRPILIGAADKRFTGGDTERAHRLALAHGADILRVHDVAAARLTLERYPEDC